MVTEAPQTAAAVAETTAPLVNAASPIGNSAYLGQVMFGLLVVLAAIFAIAWLLRRFGQGSFMANNNMRVLASLALGTRERAVMIEVGEQQILLGVAPGRVSTLHVFDEPVIETNKGVAGGRRGATPNSDFASKIRDAMAASAQGKLSKHS